MKSFTLIFVGEMDVDDIRWWWFQFFFLDLTPTWGNDPSWRIFFGWMKTTQKSHGKLPAGLNPSKYRLNLKPLKMKETWVPIHGRSCRSSSIDSEERLPKSGLKLKWFHASFHGNNGIMVVMFSRWLPGNNGDPKCMEKVAIEEAPQAVFIVLGVGWWYLGMGNRWQLVFSVAKWL